MQPNSYRAWCVLVPRKVLSPRPSTELGALRRSEVAPFWARDVSRFVPLVYWEPLGSTGGKRRQRNSPDPFGTGLGIAPFPAVVMALAVFSPCDGK